MGDVKWRHLSLRGTARYPLVILGPDSRAHRPLFPFLFDCRMSQEEKDLAATQGGFGSLPLTDTSTGPMLRRLRCCLTRDIPRQTGILISPVLWSAEPSGRCEVYALTSRIVRLYPYFEPPVISAPRFKLWSRMPVDEGNTAGD